MNVYQSKERKWWKYSYEIMALGRNKAGDLQGVGKISLSLATKREIWKSKSMSWKTILMRSFWYQKFEDPTIHVTVATCAKFWGLKFQNGFTHVQLRGRDTFFKIWPIIRICLFTWTCQHKFLPTPGKSAVLFRPSAKKVWYMIRKSKISEKIWMSFAGFANNGLIDQKWN